ncbi:MAG: 4-hydroxybenzoate octaprenyltransferase [Salinisphaera sp.]|nr:4-hydroxybenzoate octaprenyltransferase [Salinisphaera sp.]
MESTLHSSSRLGRYLRLTRLDRPIGIFLVGWPMLWALWLAARGLPDPLVLFVFVIGCVLMRSAGCAINDFADRHIDGQVARTRNRPLATGEVSSSEALLLFAGLSLAAFALVLLMNPLTIALALVGVVLAALYPFTKRFTHWPQIGLGAAFGWAVPMAFAAQTGAVPPAAWLLFAATLVWSLVYDSIYAMVDRDDDLRIGVKSTAVLWGRYDRLAIGMFQLLFFVLLVAVGVAFALRWPYYLGLAVAAVLAGYHQWLIRNRERKPCFQAFLHNNHLGMVVFVGIVAGPALYF